MTAIDNAIGTDDQIILPGRHASVSDDGLDRAFQIALLLAGNAAHAETAIQDAIASIAPDDISDRTLLYAAIECAVRTSPVQLRGRQCVDIASRHLPDSLHDVLRLSTAHRHCFVLRILVGLSREECWNLLQSDSRSIEACASAAAVELSRKAERRPTTLLE